MQNYPSPENLTPEQALELIPQFIMTVNQQQLTIQKLTNELSEAQLRLLVVRQNLHETLNNLEQGVVYEEPTC